jgi:hypothetical protein
MIGICTSESRTFPLVPRNPFYAAQLALNWIIRVRFAATSPMDLNHDSEPASELDKGKRMHFMTTGSSQYMPSLAS